MDLKPLVTHRYASSTVITSQVLLMLIYGHHRYKFLEAKEAFEITRKGKGVDGKFVIKTVISGPDVDTSYM